MISTTAIGYIVTGVIICTAIISCGGTNKLSDEAVRSVSTTCEKAGQVAHIHITQAFVKIECLTPAQPAASGVR